MTYVAIIGGPPVGSPGCTCRRIGSIGDNEWWNPEGCPLHSAEDDYDDILDKAAKDAKTKHTKFRPDRHKKE